MTSLETNRGWLDADFGLDDAARQLGIRRHLLSEAINLHVPGGFSTVLNDYRLAEFRTALATASEDESVLEIGLRCGFGSKASLHRLVKRDCGLSPGALRYTIRGIRSEGYDPWERSAGHTRRPEPFADDGPHLIR